MNLTLALLIVITGAFTPLLVNFLRKTKKKILHGS